MRCLCVKNRITGSSPRVIFDYHTYSLLRYSPGTRHQTYRQIVATMSRQAALWVCLHCFWFLHQAESNSFVGSPGVVRSDVTSSAALEWTLQSEPGRDDAVSFTSSGVDVFRYIPYTGIIPPRVNDGSAGNEQNISVSYDPRFTIYNTSTRGVGFRLANLRPEDAGSYTCTYVSLTASITMNDVSFVYDVPGRPVITASSQTLVEAVTNVSLECGASSTSLPVAHRLAMLYTWSRNGVDIDIGRPPERHALLGDNGQTLEISPVHHTDTTYTCTASESGTQLTSEETEVTLDVLHGPYSLRITPKKPSARENDSLEITTLAVCNPRCNFTWEIRDNVLTQGHILKFDRFQLYDVNNYTVRAANAHGTANVTVEVTLDTIPAPSPPEDNPSPPENNFNVIVASAAAGGVVFIIIIIVVAVCCARRRRKKKDDASVEDLVPYGSTTANDTRGFANEAVAADQGNALYAEVGKEHNRVGKPATIQDVEAPPPAIYAQVNKTKKGKKDKTANEDETNGGPEPVLYAQVDKNRQRKGKDKAKENGQRAVPDESTVPVPSHYDDVEGASAPHPDYVTSVAEDPYTDIASAGHGYSNTGQGQGQPLRPPKKVKGFTYSELTFDKDTEARPEIIHSKEPSTQYSEVDFSRTAPPSN